MLNNALMVLLLALTLTVGATTTSGGDNTTDPEPGCWPCETK